MLPTADVAAGQAVFAKCQSCHNADAGGPNGTGPNLCGVVGRKPGSHAGFAYSDGMKAFGAKQPVWDYDHIYEFLKGPQAYISRHQDDLRRPEAAAGPDQRHRLSAHPGSHPADPGAQPKAPAPAPRRRPPRGGAPPPAPAGPDLGHPARRPPHRAKATSPAPAGVQ